MAAFDPWSIFRPYMGGASAAPTTGVGSGNLTGAAPTTGAGPFGAVPQVPDPNVALKEATAGNIANLPDLTKLGAGLTDYSLDQIRKQYTAAGMDPLMAKYTGNIGQELAGQVPQDVLTQLTNYGAERGITTGLSGSPNANAAVMRALGLTSLGLMGQGGKDLSTYAGIFPKTQPADISKMLVSGAEQEQLKLLANYLSAAPDPTQKALTELNLAMMGRNAGYLGGRVTTPPGGGAGTSNTDLLAAVQAIMDKYNKNTPTTPSTPSIDQAVKTPGYGPPQGPSDEELDWRYYIGGEGLPETVDEGYYTTPFGVPTPYPEDPAFDLYPF